MFGRTAPALALRIRGPSADLIMRRRAAPRPSPRARIRCLTFIGCLTIVAATLVAACTSPAAVTRYTKSATLVTAKLPDVTDALSRSCRRTASYRLRRTSSDWYGDDSLRAACASRDAALRTVTQATRTLSAYFAALESLAENKLTDYDARVDALGGAVGDAGDFDKQQVKAIEGLAKFASSRATDGYRRTRLREAIAAQNDNVQAVTSALHEILGRDFAQLLENDVAAQTSFYRAALTESSRTDPLSAILVRDAYDERAAQLADRSAAVRSLAQALLTVGRGHQALYDARNHLGGKKLLAVIVSNARELDTAIARVEKAF